MKRFNIFLILAFFLIVSLRLYYLMYYNKEKYLNEYIAKSNVIVDGPTAKRGRILDCNGNILVDNVATKNIIYKKMNNVSFGDEYDIAYKLADILDINYKDDINTFKEFYYLKNMDYVDSLLSYEDIKKYEMRLITKEEYHTLKLSYIKEEMMNYQDIDKKAAYIYYLMNKDYDYSYKIIAKDVSEDIVGNIAEANILGIITSTSYKRIYPYGDSLKSILGALGPITKEDKKYYLSLGYSLDDIVGISFLEKEYEEYLKGTKAKYLVNSDKSLTKISDEIPGNDLYLSIDINLQNDVERVLKQKIVEGKTLKNTEYYHESYVIITEPKTGAIKAMAGERLIDTTKEFTDITANIIDSAFTMGSVVKGASISVGYKYNLIDIGTKVTDGCVKLYNVPIKCSFKRLGVLDDLKALKMSSNYYQFLIAIGLTGNKYKNNMVLNATKENFDTYRDMLASYGLGVPSNIDLPNEKTGIKGTKISDDLLLNIAIGQYDTYTPISLISYINTIANKGVRKSVSLMSKIVDNENNVVKEYEPEILNEVSLDAKYLDRIEQGFIKVMEYGGTGSGYTPIEYNPAGKTGTSESFIDSDGDGKVDTATITSSYAMYAPVNDPKYSMVIISPHVSHHNGKVTYMAYINKRISKEISNILFENY